MWLSAGCFSTWHHSLLPWLRCTMGSSTLKSTVLKIIPHNCHHPHHLRWCTFFKPAYLFSQRMLNGLLLGKFTKRIKYKSAHFLKILVAPSQNLNVTNQHPNTTDTNYANQNTRYAKQNTKYAKQNTQCAK